MCTCSATTADTSEDSRAFGPVDLDYIEGKVLVKIWPPG